ncbi:hypothetical protein [Flagellimonas ochracea]|uniref:hypothetical protein n=1 Tax=Flagellimonas ochracea TaxID=2696472 RepID=UPI001411CEB7|nr:hypothetical protein [Allomuricauda ochracea]
MDTKTGIENTGLFDGEVHVEEYRTINENTQYFPEPYFIPARVQYGGQWFYDVQLKYDVFNDQLVARVPNDIGGLAIRLFKNDIAEFRFGQAHFINFEKLVKNSKQNGFFRKVHHSDEYVLLAKPSKKRLQRRDRNRIYYEFVDAKNEYVLVNGGAVMEIGNMKDLVDFLPEREQEIESFYRTNKRLHSSDRESFLLALIKQLENTNP